ncbi:gp53-like domain-containing protein [Aeromonas caviae]|uniref:gp53-like domain-containing protein n=1 Tax=Aeromonas caviae TaxID=648 RepID=UPI003C7CA2E9
MIDRATYRIGNCQSGTWKKSGNSGEFYRSDRGYFKDTGTGFIQQWGYTSARGNGQWAGYNFPFPNQALFVTVQTVGRTVSGSNGHDYVGTFDKNGFTFTSEPDSGGTRWFAVGY